MTRPTDDELEAMAELLDRNGPSHFDADIWMSDAAAMLRACKGRVRVKREGSWVVIDDERAYALSELAQKTYEMTIAAGSNNPGFDLPAWFFTGSPYAEQIEALGCTPCEVPKNFRAEYIPDLGKVWRARRPLWECYATLAALEPAPDHSDWNAAIEAAAKVIDARKSVLEVGTELSDRVRNLKKGQTDD